MVAMVATANHRADSPSTGWRIGVDTSRSTTHRVCESEHAFTSRVPPRTQNGMTAHGGQARESCGRGGGEAATASARFYLKPAAKSVATCTAAALSRSARSLS